MATKAKSPAPATSHVVELGFKKSTPGTNVFGTDDRDVVCKQIYVNNAHIASAQRIRVTIEVID